MIRVSLLLLTALFLVPTAMRGAGDPPDRPLRDRRHGSICRTVLQDGVAGPRVVGPAAEGQPLWFRQEPAVLVPSHRGSVTLRDFTVRGDVGELRFRRYVSGRGEFVDETWSRAETRTVNGRLVSVFHPSWPGAVLGEMFASAPVGFDDPTLYWGEVLAAGSDERFDVMLRIGSGSLPAAEIVRIDDTVQYSSHVVNLVVPGFGEGRITQGELELGTVTALFYRHFEDTYQMLAVVPHAHQLGERRASHLVVQNDVLGTGQALVNNARRFGSAGTLQGVEVYWTPGPLSNDLSNHELAHQWGHYFDWARIAGLARAGHQPEAHAPLTLGPETTVGSVLLASRRVARADNGHVIERTPIFTRQHPLELYAMGLVGPEEIGEIVLFDEQGQFSPDRVARPAEGTAVNGATRTVSIDDVMRVHGPRRGSVPSRIDRATIVVSSELITPEEMAYWNFYAARLEDPDNTGILSVEGHPSFEWTTAGRVDLVTEVRPREAPRVARTFPVDPVPIARTDCRDAEFVEPLSTRLRVGQRFRAYGSVTAADRTDFSSLMVRLWRAGGTAEQALRVSGPVSRARAFDVDLDIRAGQQGLYYFEIFLFWPGAGSQPSRCTISPIVITD